MTLPAQPQTPRPVTGLGVPWVSEAPRKGAPRENLLLAVAINRLESPRSGRHTIRVCEVLSGQRQKKETKGEAAFCLCPLSM
ncbi:MAG: hypothetical protein LBK67_07230 [Coriobacteriales bacterium]|nr:hypothetical protein [Coriobacteriales bacterium]